jgi:hypothetical protein
MPPHTQPQQGTLPSWRAQAVSGILSAGNFVGVMIALHGCLGKERHLQTKLERPSKYRKDMNLES